MLMLGLTSVEAYRRKVQSSEYDKGDGDPNSWHSSVRAGSTRHSLSSHTSVGVREPVVTETSDSGDIGTVQDGQRVRMTRRSRSLRSESSVHDRES